MLSRPRLVKLLSLVAVVSLLLSSATPVARAQDGAGGSIYLPVISGGAGVAATPPSRTDLNLFRTRVTVSTPAQWKDLVRTGAVVLERGEDWALVLADDAQLTDLARWHFMPEETNALSTLVSAVAASNSGDTVAASFRALLDQIEVANGGHAADAASAAAARSEVRRGVALLTVMQVNWLVQAAGVDADNDGLTDDQEGFWCTDATKADSDSDGTSDGAEVAALKLWMNNEPSKAPSTGKPFQGWPPQKSNCFDDDQDSVPDVAESLEVGLNANRESTDRDKFDDGQELFGNTYCPGTSGYCSYGALPRNEDWGVIFAEMPSWVNAPGYHPLVAAFPVPEIDLVESSFHVATVTTVTIDKTITQGTEKSYSTARTEGTSTSVTNSENWNNWESVSIAMPNPQVLAAGGDADKPSVWPLTWSTAALTVGTAAATIGCGLLATSILIGDVPGAGAGVACLAGLVGIGSGVTTFNGEVDSLRKDIVDEQSKANACYEPPGPQSSAAMSVASIQGCVFAAGLAQQEGLTPRPQVYASEGKDFARSASGSQYTVVASGNLARSPLYTMDFPHPIYPTIRTTESGSAHGYAVSTAHGTYEEQTVTSGELFSSSESWGTATAVDSAHAADLWFTYKVRNTGTEYAREIANLAFNLYIGDDPNPATTYFVAADIGGAGKFVNFMPTEEHPYTTQRIPLSLEQMKAIDLGGPIRVVVEDFSYGIDELFYQDAASAGVLIAMEDGTDDGDEAIDTYLIPTWGSETVLNVLGRFFPHETDLNGMMTAIWTPEYRSDTPTWCQAPRRPTDQPSKAVWCKHTLSTADWWNVYTDGLGNGSEGFQDTPAVPGATALFRFNQDSDLDGFSDRSEARLGTDANDASSFPRPEVLAGVHNIQAGSKVTSTLSLLNTGLYDAYGVEAVMVAPDDSITIDNNTVGGSGRVEALKQVIVGSRIALQSPLPAPWTQANHAVPAPGGYYAGSADRTYTFTVNCGAGGCAVGEGSWTLAWNDGKGASGSLPFGAPYASPTFQAVGALGLTLALYSGSVQNGEIFTVAATTPRDTFQYTINRTPYTPPVVIVSYNDPQGNHRFVVPSQAMSLTAPTDNLQPFAGQMLQDVGVEIVTQQAAAPGVSSVQVLVNNPSDATLQNAHLFLEFINISGTVVSEVPTQVTLPPGPTYTPVSFNTGSFSPAYDAAQDYIVMAFLTDYQGNILDTAGRPLSSFQADPLPRVAVDATTLTWYFGTVAQGALLKHRPALANVGYGRLYTYLTPTPGLSLAARADVVGAADLSNYELILRTADLPLGAYDRTATLKTSDPAQPALTVRVQGTVTAAAGDTAGGLQRPLDWPVTVTGPKSQGEWVDFTHTLGPDPQSLHPVKVYPQDYATLYGVGKYATDFSAGTASYDMFGDGRDGVMPVSGNLDNNNGFGIAIVNSGAVGATSINVTDAYAGGRINPGDAVLIHQTQGTGAGCWEMNKAVSDYAGGTATIQLGKALQCNYASGGNNHAQILRVPQYSACNVTGTVTPLYAWNGSTGGILAVMCNAPMTVTGTMSSNGMGYRGGLGDGDDWAWTGEGDQSPSIRRNIQNPPGNGGGANHVSCAGGGHGSPGVSGGEGTVGDMAGTPDLATMVMGGRGGGAGVSINAGSGGAGGGILILVAKSLSVTGSITSGGGAGQSVPSNGRSGCGGAGGAIFVRSQNVVLSGASISAAAGPRGSGGADSHSGDGGYGRIHIEYCTGLTGTTSPSSNTRKLNCHVVEQVETMPYTTGRLNLPENVTTSKTYQVQYARRLVFSPAGSQITTLRVPAGMASTATLQTLVSGLSASSVITIDVGNDGSNEYVGPVTNASTITMTALAPVFNAYWVSQGAPVAGSLDVPVTVTMSQPGQVLLTNVQVTTAGSKQRTLRLNAGAVTQGTLDLALGGSGQQAISIAVDVGADGSLDWTNSVSTTLPVRLTTGNLSTALSGYLAGKSGLVDVPIRIYVAPDVPVALYDAAITMQPAVDLAAGGLGVGGGVAASGSSATTYLEGDQVPVQATLSNPSSQASGPVTAAFFATAEGWGDWYIGSAFVANIPASGSAPVGITWDTTGFSGNVPVKVVVNPYGRTGETSTTNNTVSTQVSVTPLNPPPQVDFSATPALGGAPLSVQFTSVVTNTVTSYAWVFGDGQTSSATNPSHVYAAAGVYTVTLTVSGPGGSATKRRASYITVTNTPTPPAAAFTGTPTTGAAPLTVAFTNQSTGTVSSLNWAFGDGQTSAEGGPIHQYTSAGTYTVALTVSGPGGSDNEIKAGYIQVTAPVTSPVAAFDAVPTSGTAPLAVQFTDRSSGSISSRSWSFGDGGSSTAQNPVHSYSSSGTYTVTLTVSGPGGSDVETKVQYIQVTAPTVVVAGFSAIPRVGRAPLAVQFTDASLGNITSWVWSFGDGGTSTERNPAHQYASVGNYTVSLTVIGPNGTDTEAKPGYVQVVVPPKAAFSATPTGGAPPLSVLFTDESTGLVNAWAWDFGDGGTSTVPSPAYQYESAGVYTVRLTVTGPGGSNTATQSDLVHVGADDSPVAPTAQFVFTPTQGSAPLEVQFTDRSTGTISSRQWIFGDSGTSTVHNPTHIFTEPGVYTTTLQVEGPTGQSAKKHQVRVLPARPQFAAAPPVAGGMSVSFTFNPSADVTSWLWDFGDGETSTEQNPTHTYAMSGNYEVTLTVYGVDGLSSSTELAVSIYGDAPPDNRLFLPAITH